MYERFTDKARKVMQLANQEAQHFNHEYIGTEHILLGLVKEGSGVAVHALKNQGIDLRKIRLGVEKMVMPGQCQAFMGKLPQTPKAKKVIEYSIQEARNLNHNYVGTEHLLLGLLCEEEGVGAQVLMNLGLKLADVRAEVLQLLGQPVEREEPAASSKEVQGFLMEPCPECGGPMKLHQGPRSLFLGCAAYPRCKGVRPSGQVPLDDQQERIRALERQLGTVRFLFGAFLGATAGALAGSGLGGAVGFLVGCAVALWGRLLPALLAGALGGALAGWARLGHDAGAVVGAVVGALLAGCVAELGQPPAGSRSRRNPGPRRQPPSNA